MPDTSLQSRQSDRLIYFGILLFFLGLIVGLTIPLLANPRMGLSSHLEGVMNGMFLVILGLIWPKLRLADKWLRTTYILVLYGTFANWFGILMAAVFNAGEMLGVASQGQKGTPLAEGLVNFCLYTLTVAMLAACILLLAGLRNRRIS